MGKTSIICNNAFEMSGNTSISNIIAWLFGGLIVLMGLFGITSGTFFASLFLVFSGLMLIPPAFHLINTRAKNRVTIAPRLFLALAFFIVGIGLLPSDDTVTAETPTTVEKPAQVTQQKEVKVNTQVDQETLVEKGKVLSVTDGDTLRVSINGKSVPVRLIGMNTPEINHQTEPVQCYGPVAKKALEALVLNKEITLEKDKSDKDQYGRSLRYVWAGKVLVNEYMTQKGYGFAASYPPDTKYQKRIDAGEQSAKAALTGLWATNTCNGNVYTGTYKDPNKVPETPVTEVKPTAPAPVATPYVAPPAPVSTPPQNTESSSYSCNCSKTCTQMNSCEEAQYQLNVCGCSARDGDDDGIACDSSCQ